MGSGSSRPVHASLRGPSGLVAHPAFDRIRVSEPERFRAMVRTAQLATMRAQMTQLTECTVEGTAANPARDPADRMVMAAVADGPSRLTVPGSGAEMDCAAGRLVVVAPGARFSWRFFGPVGIAALSVPAVLIDRLGTTGRRPGAAALSDSPLDRATADFVGQFALDAVSGRHPVQPRAETVVVDLIRAAVDRNVDGVDSEEAYVRAAVREVIEREFAHTSLSAARIAELLSMSRRQLYRYFEGSPETVADLIAARRVEHARELLDAPGPVQMAQVAQACGFSSAGTLRRRFEQRFAMAPREYHLQARATRRQPPVQTQQPRRSRPSRPVSDAYEAI